MQVQVLVQMQVHVPDVVFCGFYEVLCSCSRSCAGAGVDSLIVSLLARQISVNFSVAGLLGAPYYFG